MLGIEVFASPKNRANYAADWKDIQPRFNVELKDNKTFPYLQIRVREEFPRVEFTRTPRSKGVRLYGPFTSAKSRANSTG